jgi:hypothetical protein
MSAKDLGVTSVIAWLESKGPYSTAEGDEMHQRAADLLRVLDAVRAAAERTLNVPVKAGIDCQKVAENKLRKALAKFEGEP